MALLQVWKFFGNTPPEGMNSDLQSTCSGSNCMAWLKPMYVLSFTATCYGVFMIFELLPRVESIHSFLGPGLWGYTLYEKETFMVMVGFHLFLALFLYSFRMAAMSSPGRIPLKTTDDVAKWRDGHFRIDLQTEDTIKKIMATIGMKIGDSVKDIVRAMVVVERKKKYGSHRFCGFCTLYKPDRTHHCRICGKCTLRMDHHCPWLANCVGYANYKFFFLTIFYAFCLCSMMVIQMAPTVLHIMSNIRSNHLFPVVVVYSLALLLTPLLLGFLVFHFYLAMNAMSTIEYREKKNSEDPYVQRRFEVAHLKFDHGYLNNLRDAFGPLYLLPIPYFNGTNGVYLPIDPVAMSKKQKPLP
mmetsp:Transcript_34925/g.48773  ORF Transcript_34925/g.48773 Transcript_34925/m.48773 type:complete len:356 (+) Transcript_34925:81-1148(+)